jgi:glycosyltransferase involved in cell wall biosynthesis
MRICMVNDNFYRSSGVAMVMRRLTESLSDIVYCAAGCEGNKKIEDVSWVPNGRYERFHFKTVNPLRLTTELMRFRRWFHANGCDLAHCHHRRIAVLLQLAGVPVVYTGHLVFPPATWFHWLGPRRMTAVSPSVASNIFETTRRKVLACIGNPMAFPEMAPTIPAERVSNRAVCVARLEPVKGHTYLIAAWKILFERGYRYELDLVGEGSLRAALEQQARQDSIADLIHFRGFTSDVHSIIGNSLFAVLASEYEGQPVVVIEAAAMGRATLLTAVPGSIDLLPSTCNLPNGIEFQNPEQLADALEVWFRNPHATIAEGVRFFERLKRSSDPDTVARKYRNVYERALAISA